MGAAGFDGGEGFHAGDVGSGWCPGVLPFAGEDFGIVEADLVDAEEEMAGGWGAGMGDLLK